VVNESSAVKAQKFHNRKGGGVLGQLKNIQGPGKQKVPEGWAIGQVG